MRSRTEIFQVVLFPGHGFRLLDILLSCRGACLGSFCLRWQVTWCESILDVIWRVTKEGIRAMKHILPMRSMNERRLAAHSENFRQRYPHVRAPRQLALWPWAWEVSRLMQYEVKIPIVIKNWYVATNAPRTRSCFRLRHGNQNFHQYYHKMQLTRETIANQQMNFPIESWHHTWKEVIWMVLPMKKTQTPKSIDRRRPILLPSN